MATTSNKKDFNECYDLIASLASLTETYKQTSGGHLSKTPDGRGHMTPIRTGIDTEKAYLILNEVLIGGQIKKIAHSENMELISSFYENLQILYIALEKLSFGFTPELRGLLEQIRSSFAQVLPIGNLTKNEIEDNIRVIHNREQDNRDKNKINEENRKIKEIITRNFTKISILLLGVALCYLWGKTILLIYVLIICVGLFAGILSQLRSKPKRKKKKDTLKTNSEKNTQKPTNKTQTQTTTVQSGQVDKENRIKSTLPKEITDITFKIGEQTYSNFLTSFKTNEKDYGIVSKLETDLYSFFICDMFAYSIHKSEALRADILNTFLKRINTKYGVLLGESISVIKTRLENYFKTYKRIQDKSSENKGFKSIEEQMLYTMLNTLGETQVQETYAPRPQDMFEKMNKTKSFIDKHNVYFGGMLEELERKTKNYAP